MDFLSITERKKGRTQLYLDINSVLLDFSKIQKYTRPPLTDVNISK